MATAEKQLPPLVQAALDEVAMYYKHCKNGTLLDRHFICTCAKKDGFTFEAQHLELMCNFLAWHSHIPHNKLDYVLDALRNLHGYHRNTENFIDEQITRTIDSLSACCYL